MNAAKPGDWAQRLSSLDRRWLYLMLALVVAFPLVLLRMGRPIQLPTPPSAATVMVYNILNELPGESKVLVSFEYGASTRPELDPQAVAVLDHLFRNGHKVVCMTLWPDGLYMIRDALEETVQSHRDLRYGQDYVNLGFRAGSEVVIRSLTTDLPGTFAQDVYGNGVEDLPLLDNIKTLRDFDFVFSLSSGYPGAVEWIQYAVDPMGIRFSAGTNSIQVNQVLPYVRRTPEETGPCLGIIAGMPAAAEYEALLGRPGHASTFMASQSIAHLLIVGFILAGNVGFFVLRRRKRKSGERNQ